MGQWSTLIAACLLGGWALLRHDRAVLAGLLVGIACLIKLFPGLIVLYLMLRRRWLAVAAATVTVVLGAAVTVMTVGPRDSIDFLAKIAPANLAVFGAFPLNASLTGLFGRLLTDGAWVRPLVAAPTLASWLVWLASLGFVVALARHTLARPAVSDHDDKTFSLALVAMLLISPLTWAHLFVVLILPFGLLLRDRLRGEAGSRLVMGAVVVLVLLSLPDIEIARALAAHYAPFATPWYAALVMAAPTAGMFLLWRLIVARLYPARFSEKTRTLQRRESPKPA